MTNRCLIAAAGVMLLCPAASAQTNYKVQLPEDLRLSDNVRVSVGRVVDFWQGENDIKVTADAKSLIEGGFAEKGEALKKIISAEPNTQTLFSAIVENYMFDVRDKLLESKRSERQDYLSNPAPVTLGFAPQIDTFVAVITAIDVARVSLRDYLDRVLSHGKEKPLAVLHVLSKPDGATIEIDKVYKGFTCKKFVLSEGNHSVHISPRCDRNIRVSVGGPPTIVTCNGLVTCAKWSKE